MLKLKQPKYNVGQTVYTCSVVNNESIIHQCFITGVHVHVGSFIQAVGYDYINSDEEIFDRLEYKLFPTFKAAKRMTYRLRDFKTYYYFESCFKIPRRKYNTTYTIYRRLHYDNKS